MDFKKYGTYITEEYNEINKKYFELKGNIERIELTLYDKDKVEKDKKIFSRKELENLSIEEKRELRGYKEKVIRNKRIIEECRKESEKLNKYISDFKKNIKKEFLNDFAKEKNISIEKTIGIIKYVLINMSMIVDSLDLEHYNSYDIKIISEHKGLTYEEFMKETNSYNEKTYERIFILMENVVNLFEIMKE